MKCERSQLSEELEHNPSGNSLLPLSLSQDDNSGFIKFSSSGSSKVVYPS